MNDVEKIEKISAVVKAIDGLEGVPLNYSVIKKHVIPFVDCLKQELKNCEESINAQAEQADNEAQAQAWEQEQAQEAMEEGPEHEGQ